jgi:hypothetical protein
LSIVFELRVKVAPAFVDDSHGFAGEMFLYFLVIDESLAFVVVTDHTCSLKAWASL